MPTATVNADYFARAKARPLYGVISGKQGPSDYVNIGGGFMYGLGAQAGVIKSSQGDYWYWSGGTGSAGPSLSITGSSSKVSCGWSFGGSIAFAGMIVSFGTSGAEAGFGTPGWALTATYTGPLEGAPCN